MAWCKCKHRSQYPFGSYGTFLDHESYYNVFFSIVIVQKYIKKFVESSVVLQCIDTHGQRKGTLTILHNGKKSCTYSALESYESNVILVCNHYNKLQNARSHQQINRSSLRFVPNACYDKHGWNNLYCYTVFCPNRLLVSIYYHHEEDTTTTAESMCFLIVKPILFFSFTTEPRIIQKNCVWKTTKPINR